MIFVTVGTHEQQFNRLIEKIDQLKENGTISEEVFIQTGFSTYEPKNCDWEKLISYDQMINKIDESRLIITHGGPASFLQVLAMGKKPIVVPRKLEFDEHVNDHQVDFLKKYMCKRNNVTPIYDINNLENEIKNYNANLETNLESNNSIFNEKLKLEIQDILKEK